MKKRILALVLACSMAVGLAACGSSDSSSSASADTSADTAAAEEEAEPAAMITLDEFTADQPILLTSGGQSADYSMVGTILSNIGLEYTSLNMATPDDIGDNKTLIIAVGGSSKGLGAAGIDENEEIARIDELITAAENAGMTIIGMHTGGTARRGDLSDRFMEPVFSRSDFVFLVSSGDEDGFMSGICEKYGIPYESIDNIVDLQDVLPGVFE